MVGRPIGLNGLVRREKICLQYVCVRDKPGQAGGVAFKITTRVDVFEDSPSPIGRGCACFSLLSPSPNRLGGSRFEPPSERCPRVSTLLLP